MSLFDIPVDRHDTNSVKWSGLPGNDVIPMCIADMDFLAPQPITAALQVRAAHGVFGYTLLPDSLLETIVSWVARRHAWLIAEHWLALSTGVVTSLRSAIRALTAEGDGVIIQTPVYHPFFSVIRQNRRLVLENPLLLAQGKYQMDFELLEEQAAHAKLLLLCSPHNPVGRVWTPEELTRLGEICLRHGVIVVSDEIHCDITFTQRHFPFAALHEEFARQSVTCMSASKTFNIAGLETSYEIIANPVLREKMHREKTVCGIGNPNLLGVIALESAYRSCEKWLDELVSYLAESRALLIEHIGRLEGIDLIAPEGTFLAWLDFRRCALSSEAMNQFLLREARVRLLSGRVFGTPGEGFQRMNYATTHATLLASLARIADAMQHRSASPCPQERQESA